MPRPSHLPPPPPAFEARKTRILRQLSLPDAEYADASPKGAVDEGVRPLLGLINGASGFVTTSSCAGRASVFAQGRKTTASEPASQTVASGPGGKGGGGTWLYVSHDPPPAAGRDADWATELGFDGKDGIATCADGEGAEEGKGRRWILFKFEPMILHVLTASPAHAQLLLRCALQAGFRESGAVSLIPPSSSAPSSSLQTDNPTTTTTAMPVVAVRSMGLGFESLVGYVDDTITTTDDDDDDDDDDDTNTRPRPRHRLLVPPGYFDTLMSISRERFVENAKRIQRFEDAFRDATVDSGGGNGTDSVGNATQTGQQDSEWQDFAARRARMRAEGLRRKAEMQVERMAAADRTETDLDVVLGDMMS